MFYASVVQKLKLNERQYQVHWRKYARLTPLCHFVTFPPQGGRSPTFARLAVRRALPRPLSRSNRIVGPLAGDPAGRGSISPIEGTLSAYELPEAAPSSLFSPRGEVPSVGEAMREPPGPAFALRAPLIRPCGPPSPRWGEEAAPPRAPLRIHRQLSCLYGRKERSAQRSNRSGGSIAARSADRPMGDAPDQRRSLAMRSAPDRSPPLRGRCPAGQRGVTPPRTITPLGAAHELG